MPVRVLLPNAFHKHTNGAREITSTAGNLPALITEIETTFPELKTHLRDDSGQVRKFINFYVNEEDIRFLGNEKYAFQDGDEVLVIPSIAGGCCAHGDPPEALVGPIRGGDCRCCSYCGQEPCCCGD
jgi:molybdopterin converting factor small subunit